MQRRSNATTFLLVALLLGAIAMVTGVVKGKPGAPPTDDHDHENEQKTEEVAKTKTPEPAGKAAPGEAAPKAAPMTEAQKKKLRQMADVYKGIQAAHKMPSKASSAKPAGNPLSIDITSDYYTKHEDGKAGTAKIDAEIAVKQAEQKKYIDEFKRTHPTNTAPQSKPTAAPAAKTE